ncbi:MAG: M15 family metallopeptidase [Actinomycetota bacterium]
MGRAMVDRHRDHRLTVRQGLARVLAATAFAWSTFALPTVSVAAETGSAPTWMPPAYLVWRTGGLPAGLTPRLDALAGTRHVVVVAGDTLWMKRSALADGTVVDRASGRYRFPIEVMATSISDLRPFLPGTWRNVVVRALRRGRAILGTSSASLRGLGVGDRMVFGGGRLTIGAVVPDEVVAWSEALVAREIGRRLGVRHDRFALLEMQKAPTEGALARRIAPLLGPGYPPTVRRPGNATFRRQGDSVWPPVLMKRGFGEFQAYPDPAHPGYLRMHPSFVRDHLATRSVPLLGRFTCNRRVFPPLIAAMRDLRARGASGAIHNFAGCYNARMVMRLPTAPPSHHAWGAAVDINSIANPYGAPPRQPIVLVRTMLRHGFTWGGRWRVPDAMHFEFVGHAGS